MQSPEVSILGPRAGGKSMQNGSGRTKRTLVLTMDQKTEEIRIAWRLCNNFPVLCNKSPQIQFLKITHIYYLTILWARSPGMAQLGPCSRVSPGCNLGVDQAAFSSAGLTWGKFCFIQIVSRMWSIVIAGPQPSVPKGCLCFLDRCSFHRQFMTCCQARKRARGT